MAYSVGRVFGIIVLFLVSLGLACGEGRLRRQVNELQTSTPQGQSGVVYVTEQPAETSTAQESIEVRPTEIPTQAPASETVPQDQPTPTTARDTAVQPQELPVVEQESAAEIVSIKTLKAKGGRLDWSHRNNLIVFDKVDADGFYDIFTMNSDGTNEQCLTCGKSEIPTGHKGNPAWHPSGDYIVFQAEKQEHRGPSSFATPGRGLYNDLWITTSDGQTYYQLISVPQQMGVLHPHFSHDGSKLLWAERVAGRTDGGEGIQGTWALKLADFVVEGGQPRLANIRTYQPLGPIFYESHGFSSDDREIIFTGFIQPNETNQSWMDIYTMNLNTQALNRLTNSINDWDEHAIYSPSGNWIVWMSSTNCNCDPKSLRDLRTDYWLMRANGSEPVRLTSWSDSNSPQYTNRPNIAADSAWSPDGRRLAAYVIEGAEGGRIDIIEFAEPH